MNLALWILFGALVGWIASLIIGTLSSREAETMTIVGVVTGIVGGWVVNILCRQSLNNFNIFSVMSAAIVAAIAIWYYGRYVLKKK